MSPENRTPVPPKPFLIRHGRLTSSILAPLVVATGMLAFAGTAAAAQPPSGGDNHCYRTTDGRHPRPCLISIPGPQGPQGRPGPAGPCVEIDALSTSDSEEFAIAIVNGKTFGGSRDNTPATPPHTYAWTDLTTTTGNPDYPRNVCAGAVNAHGSDLWFKVITTAGLLYETHCDITGSPATLSCTESWHALATPVPAGP